MIIAHRCKVPDHLEPPTDYTLFDKTQIDIRSCHIYKEHLPYECDWIYAHFAFPHSDEHIKGSKIITLSCTPGFALGDVVSCKKREESFQFDVGDLAIVDPLVMHWLFPSNAASYNPDKSTELFKSCWTGVQWIVPRNSVGKAVRRIVEHLGGTLDVNERRFRYLLKNTAKS